MSNTFKVGEIAIWARPRGEGPSGTVGKVIPRGSEVTIVGRLMPRLCKTKEFGVKCYDAYEIEDADGHRFGALPHWLRKRYQPPDWNEIASKQTVPEGIDIQSPEYA